MLLYNKAFDPVHTVLRLSAICAYSKKEVIELERLQIFNFLLAFPAHIADMPLPRDLLQAKNKFKKYRSPYNNFEAYTLFNRMSPIFYASLQMAENLGFIYLQESGTILLQKEQVPNGLKAIVNSSNSSNSSISKEALSFEADHLSQIPILGKNGLKAVSKLMDFKYDYPQADNKSR